MNEILFFKVFNNKYLVQNIFKQIENTEWIEYDNPNQIHIGNRIKFKDIISMGWMIKNKQYSLLKCKLDNGENILIDKESIKLLFIHLNDNGGSDGNEVSILLNEILIHLLTNKRNEIEICDLTELAIECNNIKLFNLLISEPFSIIVYPSIFKYALINCDINTVKQLLSHFDSFYNCNDHPIISNQLKENSLVYSSKNIKHSQEIIKFILDSNLYTITTPITSTTNEKIQTSIDFNDFLRLDSIEIKMKLFQLNLLVGYTFLYNDFINEDSSFEEISLYYKISIGYLKYSKNQKDVARWEKVYNGIQEINENEIINQNEKIKLLRKLIIIDKRDRYNFHQFYLTKYQESINEFNGCDKLISKNDGQDDSNFILLYRYIGSNQSGTSADHFCKLTVQQFLSDKRIVWFNIFNYIENDIIIVTDTLVVDWLVNNYGKDEILNILLYGSVNCNGIEFSTLELLQYTIKLDREINGEFGLFNRYTNYLCSFFKKAIAHCDLQALNFIIQIFRDGGDEMETDKLQNYSNIRIELPPNINDIKILLNYLNSNFNCLDTDIFIDILSKISLAQHFDYQEITSKINFNFYNVKKIKREFVYSMYRYDYQMIRLFLNLIGDFKLLNITNLDIHKGDNITGKLDNEILYSGFNFDQISSIIDKLVSIYQNDLINLKSLEIILNQFYEMTISIKGISFDQVNEIIKKIEKLVFINHVFYHSFHYLNIKSKKLSSYILSLPDIFKVHCSNSAQYKLSNYIDISKFTMDYIQVCNYDDIIFEIINQLFQSSSQQPLPNNIKIQFINYNINHCLEIRNWNLLNKLLDSFTGNTIAYTKSKQFILKPITFGLKIDLVEKLLEYDQELLNQILNQSIWYCRFDIIEYLLSSNYKINSIDSSVLFSTSINNISYITSPLKLYQLFSEISKNQEVPSLIQNLFNNSFLIGNFKMCDLILQFFPNQIILSNSIISTTISKNQIYILNYYKDKNSLLFSNDNSIYFKNQLLNHNNYKYLKK